MSGEPATQQRDHWDQVFATKTPDQLSWYVDSPATSLRLVRRAAPSGAVVDVGAGESRLADELLADGYDVTLLDISGEALAVVRQRLGAAGGASYVVSDVLGWAPPATFAVWHDRAVCHFLVAEEQQRAYARIAASAVGAGGAVVLGTFAPDGPESCSGLPTARHDPASLAAVLAEAFTLEHDEREEHRTPWGAVQPFTWVVLRRT